MRKLASLRTAILAADPAFRDNPEKLSFAASNGRVVAGGAEGKGGDYHYKITAIAQDFAGDFDVVAFAVLQWIRAEMPGVLLNPETADKVFRFEVEVLTSELVDLLIEVDVVESMTTDDGVTFDHPLEQPVDSFERLLSQ